MGEFDLMSAIREALGRFGGQGQNYTPDLNYGAYQGAMGVAGETPRSAARPLFNTGPVSGAGDDPGFMDGMAGYTDAEGIKHNGWGGMALGAGQGLLGGYLGMQQYGLAKEQLEEGKRQFNQNFETQRKMTNTRLEDRQKARRASNPGAYESPGAYMKKHGV